MFARKFGLSLSMGVAILCGCSDEGGNGKSKQRNGDGSTSKSQLAKDHDLIRRSIADRHAGGNPKIKKWNEPETYYAALTGIVDREGYSGISHVFSESAALESVDRSNQTEIDLLVPGEELLVYELKRLEPIGWRIVVEYDAGLGSDKAAYRDTYLVYDQVMIINGELERQGREAILQGSSSISADSTIRSGR